MTPALSNQPRQHACIQQAIRSLVCIAGAQCAGQCLYVSGVPGTGKTATVLDAVHTLRHRCEAGQLSPFQFVEINALRLPTPAHAYCVLYEVGSLKSCPTTLIMFVATSTSFCGVSVGSCLAQLRLLCFALLCLATLCLVLMHQVPWLFSNS